MPKFVVTIHTESEEVVTVEAADEQEAESLALTGEGTLLDYYSLDSEVTDLVTDEDDE